MPTNNHGGRSSNLADIGKKKSDEHHSSSKSHGTNMSDAERKKGNASYHGGHGASKR
jgi:hypothetical protein